MCIRCIVNWQISMSNTSGNSPEAAAPDAVQFTPEKPNNMAFELPQEMFPDNAPGVKRRGIGRAINPAICEGPITPEKILHEIRERGIAYA